MSKTRRARKRRQPRIRRDTPAGAPPGLPVVPSPKALSARVFALHENVFLEEKVRNIRELPAIVDAHRVTWIDISSVQNRGGIQQLGELFGLHPLALEDVVNVHQRAKVEAYENSLFIVARMVQPNQEDTRRTETEQVSFFVGKKFLITFQERPGDCFEPVRDRLRKSQGRIRMLGTDYLAYTLIDAIIDSYFPVLEHYADVLDSIEETVAHRADAAVIHRIHDVRNDLLLLRRAVRPHRTCLNELVRDEHPLIKPETRVYFRDCYDHSVQLFDLLDVYRELCSDVRDYYLSIVSNRMNEVMKVLTIISTVFIPLGFVASLYGMNFNTQLAGNMPELNWPYAYLGVLGLMSSMTAGMVYYFYRRGWLRSDL